MLTAKRNITTSKRNILTTNRLLTTSKKMASYNSSLAIASLIRHIAKLNLKMVLRLKVQ
jgi:hypothetical protein